MSVGRAALAVRILFAKHRGVEERFITDPLTQLEKELAIPITLETVTSGDDVVKRYNEGSFDLVVIGDRVRYQRENGEVGNAVDAILDIRQYDKDAAIVVFSNDPNIIKRIECCKVTDAKYKATHTDNIGYLPNPFTAEQLKKVIRKTCNLDHIATMAKKVISDNDSKAVADEKATSGKSSMLLELQCTPVQPGVVLPALNFDASTTAALSARARAASTTSSSQLTIVPGSPSISAAASTSNSDSVQHSRISDSQSESLPPSRTLSPNGVELKESSQIVLQVGMFVGPHQHLGSNNDGAKKPRKSLCPWGRS